MIRTIRNTRRALCIAIALATAMGDTAQAQPEAYQEGQRAIRERQWDTAIELFEEAERAGPRYKDAAIYWQAYAYCRSGRERLGQRRIRTLERHHPESKWLDDAQALSVECADGESTTATSELEPELQLFVLSQMMERDPERALPMVIRTLENSPSPEIRRQALFVLGMSETREGQEAIVRFARNTGDPGLQMEAIHVLGAAGDEDAVVLLDSIYQDTGDPGVRAAILQAWAIAENEELLIKALRNTDDPRLQRQAIQSLGVMEASEALRGLYQEFSDLETRRALLQAFAIAEDSEALKSALETETEPELRQVAIRSLAIAEGSGAAETLVAVYRRSQSREEKMAVLEGLMILEAQPDLVAEIARGEHDRELQGRAIQTLGVMEATGHLRDLYGSVADPELRAMVLQSLAIAEDTQGLIQALESERDPRLRASAIQALAITDDGEAAGYLRAAYPGAGPEERRSIIQAMMILEDAPALIDMLESETDPQLRRAILQTLTQIDSDEATEYLFELMERGG